MDQFHIVFHENILETFIFSLVACFGILQAIIGWRGLHGLCVYGNRVSPRINYSIGAVCLIFGYAYYFTNPEHQNTRNIEGFMSMACLAAGILAAIALTLILSSAVQGLQRVRRRGKERTAGALSREAMEAKELDGLGTLYLPKAGGELAAVEKLVVVDREGYTRQLERALAGAGAEGSAVLEPDYAALAAAERDMATMAGRLYSLAVQETGAPEGGLAAVGLGAGASMLLAIMDEKEGLASTREATCFYPLIRQGGLLSDAYRENTLADLARTMMREFHTGALPARIYRAWAIIFVIAAAASFTFTFAFNMRWKVLSSLIAAVAASVYLVTMYLTLKQPWLLGGRLEKRLYALAELGEEAVKKDLPLPVRVIQPPGRSLPRVNRIELITVKSRIRSDFLSDPKVAGYLGSGGQG